MLWFLSLNTGHLVYFCWCFLTKYPIFVGMNHVSISEDFIIFGTRLHCSSTLRDEHAPTIIFLHESFGCIRHWRDFPEKLGEITGFNTLVYDRQGYGQSDSFTVTKRTNDYLEREADVLNQLMETLALKEVILFGHSDGGSIALLAAAKYPEKIKMVITEGAHVLVEEVTLDGIRKAEELYENGNLKEKLGYYHGEKTEMVFRLWADTWLSEEFRSWNIEHFLKRIQCLVLIIQGKKDEYGTIKQVESIRENVPGPVGVCMPEAGHTPHRETPEVVIAAVQAFLKLHSYYRVVQIAQ